MVTTLPTVSMEKHYPLDRLRLLIRRSPELKKLGRTIGTARCYTPDEVALICRAYEAKYGPRAEVATC